jgi:hypothetical protein
VKEIVRNESGKSLKIPFPDSIPIFRMSRPETSYRLARILHLPDFPVLDVPVVQSSSYLDACELRVVLD